jgi:hypothetical protein
MSALVRPNGDEIAVLYGPYKTKREITKIKVGDKLDMLCSDGLNYHVDVKEILDDGKARLHFRHWSAKYDYVGPIDNLYLADQGKYSDGISSTNTYPTLAKLEAERKQKERYAASSSARAASNGSGKDYSSETRYPEDFLAKPRPYSSKSRKRQSSDGANDDEDHHGKRRGSNADSINSDDDDDNSPDGANDEDTRTGTGEGPGKRAKKEALPKHRLLSHDSSRSSGASSGSGPSGSGSGSGSKGHVRISEGGDERGPSDGDEKQLDRQQLLTALKDALHLEKAITETAKAIEIVDSHGATLFGDGEAGNGHGHGHGHGKKVKPSKYTSKQLLELLSARKNIDEVILQVVDSLVG